MCVYLPIYLCTYLSIYLSLYKCNGIAFADTGAAVFSLAWSSASQPLETVPPYRLFPALAPIKDSPFAVAPTSRKPSVVQSPSLAITSWQSLRISFSPPVDDGGSPIVGYGVEWFSAHEAYGALEVQTIRMASTVVGGTFGLSYNGERYRYPVPFDASARSVAAVLEDMAGVGEVSVRLELGAAYRSWVITFVSNLAAGQGNAYNPSVGALAVDDAGLLSSSAVKVVVCGSVASGVLGCGSSDSVTSSALLVNGSYSGSSTYPSLVDLAVGSQGYLTYDVHGLVQSSSYTEGFTFRVYAKNAAGFISLPTQPITMKPMAVADVPAYAETINVSGSDSAVNVYWTEVLFPEDRASPVSAFQVEWSTNSTFANAKTHSGSRGSFTSPRIPMNGRAVLQYTLSDLVPGGQYYVRVCSVNAVGTAC